MEIKKVELLKEIKSVDKTFPIGTVGILHTTDKEHKNGAILIENYGFIVSLKDIKILN